MRHKSSLTAGVDCIMYLFINYLFKNHLAHPPQPQMRSSEASSRLLPKWRGRIYLQGREGIYLVGSQMAVRRHQ